MKIYDDSTFDLILSCIRQSIILQTLVMSHDEFTPEQTKQLFDTLLNCPSIVTLEYLYLHKSANFSEDGACESFARLIDKALMLTNCNISQ